MPPSNVSLACRVFQGEKRPKDSRTDFHLPLNCQKNLSKGSIPGIELSGEVAAKTVGEVWWGKLGRAWRSKIYARGKRYGNICICITDSLCYKAETNTPL